MTRTAGTRRVKSFDQPTAGFKAVGQIDDDGTALKDGEFIATAAVFGNIDSYGERVVKGAFDETLAEWEASGDPIPVIWYHAWSDIWAHVGYVVWARQTDGGLLYKGVLDIADNPMAAQLYRLMKGRRIKQQSFGFDILDAREIVEEGKSVFEITKVKLFEVGPCLVGVNQATELLDIKSTDGTAPAAPTPEPSGQVTPSATDADDDARSDAPGSNPEPVDDAPASKGLTPASARLHLEILEMETN